ncbi:MAG: CDP-alcohol phosphatidyltransferase family protein [Phycisphaerales bacterium]|nr:CDP-alcohol phosphatidyltransferase family protein [Phycisphaerales bacterium]
MIPPPFSPAPHPPHKYRRGVAILPSLFTLGNCLCGFAAIHYAALATMGVSGAALLADESDADFAKVLYPFAISGYYIFAAMLFDMFDGFVARLTRSTSDFGAELDSLADMVSFGVAPAFLSINLISLLVLKKVPASMKTLDIPGPFSDGAWARLFWVVAAIYVSCTALRLARFNVINKHDVSSHMNFRGMPSPAAAAVVASTIIFFVGLYPTTHYLPFNVPKWLLEFCQSVFPYLLPVVLLSAALLMVSRFAYSHLINRFLRGRKKFRMVVFYMLLIMVLIAQPQLSALIAIYIYALSAPTVWLYRLVIGRQPAPSPPPPAS